jgi:hypothetical protein
MSNSAAMPTCSIVPCVLSYKGNVPTKFRRMMTMCFFVSKFPTACIDQRNVTADQFNHANLTNRPGSNSIWTVMDLVWILFVCVIFSGINLYHREMGSSIRLRFGVGRVLYNVAIHIVRGLERSRSRVIAQTPEKVVALDMELKVKKQQTKKTPKWDHRAKPAKAGPAVLDHPRKTLLSASVGTL